MSVIVPCRNEFAHIKNFLESLQKQHLPAGGVEFIIADGCSEDGTTELIADASSRDSRIRLIMNPELTVSHGLNRAILEARGEIIIRMDVHTVYAPDYIVQCVRCLYETGAQNVGGPARTLANGYWQEVIAAAYASPFAVGGARFHFPDYEGEVDTVTYGTWFRSTLLELGGFDEKLVRNQDDELNYRIRSNGGRIWQSPSIVSWYAPRTSLRTLFAQYFQYGYWRIHVIRKHGTPASARHLIPALFIAMLLVLTLASPFSSSVRRLLAIVLALYGAFVLMGALLIVARSSWRYLPALPLTIMTFHFAYGLGFLSALTRFRSPRATRIATRLTR